MPTLFLKLRLQLGEAFFGSSQVAGFDVAIELDADRLLDRLGKPLDDGGSEPVAGFAN